jgi:hypothetical protein
MKRTKSTSKTNYKLDHECKLKFSKYNRKFRGIIIIRNRRGTSFVSSIKLCKDAATTTIG